jgi:hypothetical protein
VTLDHFSEEAQQGLRLWSVAVYGDELMLDGIGGATAAWAWIAFLLRESPDRPEWFPKGKWATIQFLETELIQEARQEVNASI